MKKMFIPMILLASMSGAIPAATQDRLTQIVLSVTIGNDDIRQGRKAYFVGQVRKLGYEFLP